MTGMTVSTNLAEFVRQRANFACEFCGVTENDSAGRLTVDHFQPQAHGGADDASNLLYCCYRCNLYKGDYWPTESSDFVLWNPRQEPANRHWLTLADATLHGLTPCGGFTINRLRLNRRQLVEYRFRKTIAADEQRLLARYRELVALLERLHQQQLELLAEHRTLLAEQRELLRSLLSRKGQ